jgi:hypothetical protein
VEHVAAKEDAAPVQPQGRATRRGKV